MAICAPIIHSNLYVILAAFPIIFINQLHWNQGVSDLTYVDIMIGHIIGVPFSGLARPSRTGVKLGSLVYVSPISC